MMLLFEAMQLHDDRIALHEAFVLRTTVTALDAEQPLIESAAGLDVLDCDKGLRAHGGYMGAPAVDLQDTFAMAVIQVPGVPTTSTLRNSMRHWAGELDRQVVGCAHDHSVPRDDQPCQGVVGREDERREQGFSL